MKIDTTTLRRIRAYRVIHDPIVPHKPRQAWLKSAPGHVVEGTVESRYRRLEGAPTDEPIRAVTWPELAAWCETASMDADMVSEEFVGIYQYTLQQHIEALIGESSEKLLPGSFTDRVPITDRHKRLAERQRETLKKEQDEHFINELYDEIPFNTSGVRKVFWKQNTVRSTSMETSEKPGTESESESGSEQDSTGGSKQIGLDMF